MTLLPRGRGGWAARRTGYKRAALIAAAALALALASGCSSQQKPAQTGQGTTGPGMGQNGIGAGGGSSLSQFQKGTLGQGGQGPLSDIHFDYNDYSIRPQDSQILQGNANWLSKHANTRVQIEGNCDNRGSEEYNLALGAKRAQAAKDYLETLGIAGQRMSTISYGKELPLCTENTEECWAENRRDHFVVGQ
jgi:peptidoglycan-associated lipoprotein